MSEQRKRFEAFYASQNGGVVPSSFNGEYDYDDAQACWLTWQAACPEGWQAVPKEPSFQMLSADGCASDHGGKGCIHHENRKRIWSAMLSAAPKPGDV